MVPVLPPANPCPYPSSGHVRTRVTRGPWETRTGDATLFAATNPESKLTPPNGRCTIAAGASRQDAVQVAGQGARHGLGTDHFPLGPLRGRTRRERTVRRRHDGGRGHRRRRVHRAFHRAPRRGQGPRLPGAGGRAHRPWRIGAQRRPCQRRGLAPARRGAQGAGRGLRPALRRTLRQCAGIRLLADRTAPDPLRADAERHDPRRPRVLGTARSPRASRRMEAPRRAGRDAGRVGRVPA
jgi:hypothetical protein